jgi:mannose-6-phosphate isomerase-like protein (cupin superfamily)
MLRIIVLTLTICCTRNLSSQLYKYQSVNKKIDNIEVLKISEDSLHSTFQITIPNKVALHYHEYHTENIIVIHGKARMKLGNDTIVIKKGDQVTIPMKTEHEVIKVLSRKPLSVYSIQSPKFDGTDRIILKP